MDRFSPREKKFLLGLGAMVLLAVSFFLGKQARNNPGEEVLALEDGKNLESPDPGQESPGPIQEEEGTVFVHLTGAIASPGLLELEAGSRLADAIEAAGGALEGADLARVNLARVLEDEDRIHIPALGEADEDLPQVLEPEGSGSSQDGLVSINKGTKEELMSLPGIGDKTADKIIDYREATPFGAIEDIQEVSGIGEKKFQDIQDKIKL